MPDSSSISSRPALDINDQYQAPPPGVKEWIFVTVLCSTQLFVQGAFGYILLPLRIVASTFGQGSTEATRMTWHVGGYSLTVGTFILIAGKLGDRYGSKLILVVGWVWFGVWSIIGGCSAFTHSPIFLDTTRALQGIGPAFLLPNALAILGRTYPPGSKKNAVFSAFAVAAPLGCSTAGAIGSAFAQYIWWPWVMGVYALGCFILAGLAQWVVPYDRPEPVNEAEQPPFDIPGAALGVCGLVLLNVSWTQAPIDGWGTPYVYVLLILGLLALGAFAIQERWAKDPILDVTIFNRHVVAVLVTTGLGWSSFAIWFYYLFQFIQQFRGVSPLDSAAQFAPGAVSGIMAAISTPLLMRFVPNGWLMVVACGAFFIGCLLQATAAVAQSYWYNTFWSFVVTAWGMDISFPASATILSNTVPPKHQGVSASLVNTVVNYSIAIGLGIAGTVEAQVQKHQRDVLAGYRAALWSSVGLAAAGLTVAVTYALFTECVLFPRKLPASISRRHQEMGTV
ncbi:ABC multidrug transporter mdr3 [Paecilomyces lecythidis]|uniref:ABC multidrug transporter mdr3 n=1 Tax=Paecilomyces lecythidis TaxID=3004212 RepID=A0ABR3XK41_9EURO